MKVKICSKCNEEKDTKEFSKCVTTKDKLRPECKKCVSKYHRDHYLKNKDKKRRYYEENIDSIKKYQKKWRKDNKDYLKIVDFVYIYNLCYLYSNNLCHYI